MATCTRLNNNSEDDYKQETSRRPTSFGQAKLIDWTDSHQAAWKRFMMISSKIMALESTSSALFRIVSLVIFSRRRRRRRP